MKILKQVQTRRVTSGRLLLDRSNPLTRGLLVSSVNTLQQDAVTGGTWTITDRPFIATAEGLFLKRVTGTQAAHSLTGVIGLPTTTSPRSMSLTVFTGGATLAGKHWCGYGNGAGASQIWTIGDFASEIGALVITNDVTVSFGTLFPFEHIVTTYDGTTVIVYRNGNQVTSAARTLDTQANTTNGTVYIGGHTTGSLLAEVDVGRINIWNRAISAEEVKSLYEKPMQLYQPIRQFIPFQSPTIALHDSEWYPTEQQTNPMTVSVW